MIFKPTEKEKKLLTEEKKNDILNNIQITFNDLKFTVKILVDVNDLYSEEIIKKEDNVAEFEFYRDQYNKVWANKIVTFGIYQGIGVGKLIIKQAILKYGEIYFSNATQLEKSHFSKDKENDFRYFSDALNFEESNIGLFALSLLNKGIINKSHIKNPYK